MKNNTYKNLFSSLLPKGVWAILGSLSLVSCGIQSGYTETDGIYYDPNSDKIEQRMAWQEPRYNEDFYDYEGGIIGQSQKNQKQQNEKYNNKNWGNNQKINTSSDWGVYAGTQNNYYYDSFSTWGNPYHFYSPYYFGYYNSYFGNYYSGWNMGFSWGTPWGYTPYYGGYSPYWHSRYYYNSWYAPFYPSAYYYGGYYGNYYGYPYYNRGYYPVRNYRRSGADNTYRGSQPNTYRTPNNNSWGRANTPSNQGSNRGFDRPSSWGNHSGTINNSGNINPNSTNTWRNSNPTPPSNNTWNNSSSGGFGRQPSWGGSSGSNGRGFRTR